MYYHYPVPVKRSTLAVSHAILIVLIAGGVAAPFLSLTLLWFTGAIVAYILYNMRLSARMITLSPTHLIINLRLGKRKIPLNEIRSVQTLMSIDLNWPLIPLPTIFGKNGTYRTPLLGRFNAYVGNPSLPMIRLTADTTSVVLALSDIEQLCTHLYISSNQQIFASRKK